MITVIIILVIIIFYLEYKLINKHSEVYIRGYKKGLEDLSKTLMDDLDQKSEQYKLDKKIKDEKFKNNTSTSSNDVDKSADSSGL